VIRRRRRDSANDRSIEGPGPTGPFQLPPDRLLTVCRPSRVSVRGVEFVLPRTRVPSCHDGGGIGTLRHGVRCRFRRL